MLFASSQAGQSEDDMTTAAFCSSLLINAFLYVSSQIGENGVNSDDAVDDIFIFDKMKLSFMVENNILKIDWK